MPRTARRGKSPEEFLERILLGKDGMKPKTPPRPRIMPERTSLKAKLRSKPPRGQEYLELYLMSKEIERLESYRSVLGRKLEQTLQALEVCRREIRERGKGLLSSRPPRGGATGDAGGDPERAGGRRDGPTTLIPFEY